MKNNKTIFIACDTSDERRLKKIISVTKKSKLKIGYKIGLEFFYSKNGRRFLSKIKNKNIFLDLKLNDIPLLFQDERMSSQAVEKIFISHNVSRKKRSLNIDKHAACWILQSALDFLKKR